MMVVCDGDRSSDYKYFKKGLTNIFSKKIKKTKIQIRMIFRSQIFMIFRGCKNHVAVYVAKLRKSCEFLQHMEKMHQL